MEKEVSLKYKIFILIIEIHLGEPFYKYKQDVNSIKDIVERHFSKLI
jgi:hypothetical protein